MKVLLCKQHGFPEQLELTETAKPVIKPNQVLINVKACGVNFPDALIIQNLYQFKPDLPFAPGGEVSGIEIVGTDVSHIKVGDPVFTLTGWGGFAEYVAADAHKCLPMPLEMNFVTGATGIHGSSTSYKIHF